MVRWTDRLYMTLAMIAVARDVKPQTKQNKISMFIHSGLQKKTEFCNLCFLRKKYGRRYLAF